MQKLLWISPLHWPKYLLNQLLKRRHENSVLRKLRSDLKRLKNRPLTPTSWRKGEWIFGIANTTCSAYSIKSRLKNSIMLIVFFFSVSFLLFMLVIATKQVCTFASKSFSASTVSYLYSRIYISPSRSKMYKSEMKTAKSSLCLMTLQSLSYALWYIYVCGITIYPPKFKRVK